MSSRWISAAFVVVSFGYIILSPCAFAKEKKPPTCIQFVHYDKSNFSITLPTIHSITLGSLSKKSDKVQAAADLTQLFDLIQFSNCQVLDRLAQQPDDKQYMDASRAMLDSNNKLLELAIRFSAYSKDEKQEGKLAETATSSLSTAKSLQASSTETNIKAVNLDTIASQLHGELSDELARLTKAEPLPREQLWSLISEANKDSIRKQLKQVLEELRKDGHLQVEEKDLAAFILMPGGDGQMYFPPGLFVRPSTEPQKAPAFSIPTGYGASGLAFEENKQEFVDINDTMLRIGSSEEAAASQKKIRMILLPEEAMRQIHARYIAAFPIDNSQRQPIAVMSISVYKVLQRGDDLRDVCNNLEIGSITSEIAQLLTLSKAK